MVPSAVGSHASDAKPASTLASEWSGTVRVVTDVPFQTQSFTPTYTFGYTRHDEAVYTLSGQAPTGVDHPAAMKGSGTGRAVNTFTNVPCEAPVDPAWEWTYDGPASVAIAYANGQFSIRPRGVQGMARNFYVNPSCGSGSNEPFAKVLPPNIEETAPTAMQSGSATQKALKGQQSFRWLRNPDDTIVGTMTVEWDLSRGSATPPPRGSLEGGPAPGYPLANVKAPGESSFSPVTRGEPIQPGTVVDVSGGKGITLSDPKGKKTVFYGEKDGVPSQFVYVGVVARVAELRLTGGNFASCSKRALASFATKKKPVRRLWGKGKGSFRTKGRYASSTVRGTWWLTADTCTSTLVQVKEGSMVVRDLLKRKAVIVKAPGRYEAGR